MVLRVGLRRRYPLAAALETVELHTLRDCAVHDDARLVVAAPDVGDRLRYCQLGLATGSVVISVETRPAFAEEIVRLPRDPLRDRPEVQVPSLVTRLFQGIDVLEVLRLDRRAWSRVRVLVRRVRRISAPFPGRLEEGPRRLHVAAPHGVHVRRVLFGRNPAHREADVGVGCVERARIVSRGLYLYRRQYDVFNVISTLGNHAVISVFSHTFIYFALAFLDEPAVMQIRIKRIISLQPITD